MVLLDLLQIINDHTKVNVWLNDERVAIYDGKNAIDSKYNNYRVVECGIVNDADCMYIEIVEN